ncbi:GLPGLI family protein [Flavobacterium rakeshii]|uniref:GLPGLI family protein n=1 Tax=Flavobacterium rakeshii TaxID=1038845 RepID=A0A6N8H9P7_9FLAO|nr:GLPGLI family protein [Flavobacterium rakeshii]MUV03161.1 GLPGLI family protein [Flavobacterium rakeshii]
MKYFLLLFPCFIFSQNMYNIEYIEKNEADSYYLGKLYANEIESVYIKKDTTWGEATKGNADNDFVITDAVDEMSSKVKTSLPLSFEPIVCFNKTKEYFTFTAPKLYEKGKIIIQDSLPNIKWKITNETKVILNFKCQKAIGEYKCREYVVWFTKNIPLNIGPWHLNGLPGAILEAKATDQYLEFTAIRVQHVKNNSKDIKNKKNNLNKINEIVSFSDYLDKLDEASIALSKTIINNVSEKKVEGARITSITTVSSYETHDLCREKKKKQVKKDF